MPKEDLKKEEPKKDANGEKNGDKSITAESAEDKQKLSLGEIAAIDAEISKAKTEQLQVLHNVRRLIRYASAIVLTLRQRFVFSYSTGRTGPALR